MGASATSARKRSKRVEKVEQVPVESLKPHPKNESIYQDEPDNALVDDIREAGIRQPIICDKKTRAVISGRRRVMAAKMVGLATVPVIFRDYDSKDDVTESIIKANWYRQKSQAQTLREIEALLEIERRKARERQAKGGSKPKPNRAPQHLTVPAKKGAGVTFGRSPRKIDKEPDTTRSRIGAKVGMADRSVQHAMKIIDIAKAKHGKKWEQDDAVRSVLEGKKTITRASQDILKTEKEERIEERAAKIKDPVGDVRCKDNIDDLLDESVDHVIVDPPYGIATSFNAQFEDRGEMTSTFDDWDDGKLSFAEIGRWCTEWVRVLRTGGNIAVFTADTYASFIKEALRLCGVEHLQVITWHKTNPEPSLRKIEFCSSCEFVVVGCKGGKRKTFNWQGQKEMHNFVEGPICAGRERLGHPTQKPMWLVKWLVERLTNKGDLVLDNFAGVGTTAAACKSLKRQFIAVEKSRKYVNAIKVRLAS
jgi:site-specific DNA-methyltransferase (adenine-specific)